MALFGVKILGIKRIVKGAKKYRAGVKNMRAVNLRAAVIYEQWIKRNFRDKGTLHENAHFHWKPLAESTVKGRRKGKKKRPDMILRDTDDLMNRWQITADNKQAVIKSGVKYSSVHEKGSGRAKIPQRKIFPTEKQGQKIVDPVYKKYMDQLSKW